MYLICKKEKRGGYLTSMDMDLVQLGFLVLVCYSHHKLLLLNTGHFPLEEDLDVSVSLIKRFLGERIKYS